MSYSHAEFDSKKMLKRLKRWHKEYCDLYGNGPLIACMMDGVHIDDKYAEQFAPVENWTVTERKDESYPYKISTTVDGLYLFAIGTAAQLERFLSKQTLISLDQETAILDTERTTR